MADEDSIQPKRRGRGRPRKAGFEHLPPGVYARVRNGNIRYYDARGKALAEGEIPVYAARTNRRYHALTLSPTEIVRRSLPADHLSGVYFLLKADEVVYVGQSVNMYRRVEAHRLQGKDFDRVTYLPAREEVLRELEMVYIHLYRPAQNVLLPSEKRRHIYEGKLPERIERVLGAGETPETD